MSSLGLSHGRGGGGGGLKGLWRLAFYTHLHPLPFKRQLERKEVTFILPASAKHYIFAIIWSKDRGSPVHLGDSCSQCKSHHKRYTAGYRPNLTPHPQPNVGMTPTRSFVCAFNNKFVYHWGLMLAPEPSGHDPKQVGAHLCPSSWSPRTLRGSSSATLFGEDELGTLGSGEGPTFLHLSWLMNAIHTPSLEQPAWFGNPSLGTVLGAIWPGRAALSLACFLYVLGHPKGLHTSVFSQSEGD